MFVDIFSKCRICLLEEGQKVSIYESQNAKRYSDLIKECTGLEIVQDDNLPSEICKKCLSELMVVVKFVSKVRTSVEKLNKLLDNGVQVSDNSQLKDDDDDDEEKIPLSVLGANLKKEKQCESEDDFLESGIQECDDEDKIKDEVKVEPQVISLDNLNSFLSDEKNKDFVCVTVNNITIKKEKKVNNEQEMVPIKKNIKKLKIKTIHKLKKKHKRKIILSELDTKYVTLKAGEHGLAKDMLKCLTCGHLLYNRSAFKVHYRRHTGERPFKCKQCGKSFGQLGGLNEHVKNVHLGLKRTKPKPEKLTENDPDENITFKILKAQEYDLRKDKVQCLACRLICENKSAFVVHYRKHSGERPFQCQHCQKSFPRMGTLNDHIKNIHSNLKKFDDEPAEDTSNAPYTIVKCKDHPNLWRDMVQCLICKLLLNDKYAFRIHYRKHTGERPFKCSQCNKTYRRMGDLNDHIRKIHLKKESLKSRNTENRNEESCICYACGKSFKHKSSLTIHLRTHTDEKPHECSYCLKKFIRSQELSLHIRIHHTFEKPYSCHLCGKTFAAGTQLKSHLFVHTDEKNFKCKICDTAVKTKDSLAKHMRVMHTTRKNICDICGAAFAFRYGLRDHMKNRHSEKAEMCGICKKSFSDLRKHMITHSDQKPFGCQLCQKGFFRQKSLKVHMVKHHNESPSSMV